MGQASRDRLSAFAHPQPCTAHHVNSSHLSLVDTVLRRCKVVAGDGYTYEKVAIQAWLHRHKEAAVVNGASRPCLSTIFY